jgi:NADH:ubiquinone oxidoreductase subunit H
LLILNLLRVAFFTLIERKIIRINHLRLGPNKLIFIGILQPIIDGFKLFLKIINNPVKNNFFFFFRPFLSFLIRNIFLSFLILERFFFKNMFFLFILGISIYSLVLAG